MRLKGECNHRLKAQGGVQEKKKGSRGSAAAKRLKGECREKGLKGECRKRIRLKGECRSRKRAQGAMGECKNRKGAQEGSARFKWEQVKDSRGSGKKK
jgi:hypothetical protein